MHGASGKSGEVRNRRTFLGASCSVNHEVPGSSSSSTFSFSFSESSLSRSPSVMYSAVGGSFAPGFFLLERCARDRW